MHLNITVTDTEDHSVTGLREQDFMVFEDGVPQQVAMFNGEGAPLSVVLMIDGSGSMEDTLPAARVAAERVVAVEADPAFLVDARGRWFADVVKESTLLTNGHVGAKGNCAG